MAIATAVIFVYSASWAVYLLFGHESKGRFPLPWAPYRCVLVVRAAYEYMLACVGLAPYALLAIRSRPPDTCNIKYAMPFHGRTLDVYPAQPSAPVIVLVPSFMHPVRITGSKRAYIPLAQRLNRKGYCVVVPSICYSSVHRMRRAVIDMRLVLSWVGAHIEGYGGDSDRIYVMGHGLAAHLVLLTVAQEAVVLSRSLYGYSVHEKRSPSAIRGKSQVNIDALEIYAGQIRLPQLRGLLLAAGAYDVIKACHSEISRGTEHLSLIHSMAGPTVDRFLQHSPAHLLASAHEMLDSYFLPPRVLILHGGNDHVFSIEHATLLHTQLCEVGIETAELCAVRSAGHVDLFACLHGAAVTDFVV